MTKRGRYEDNGPFKEEEKRRPENVFLGREEDLCEILKKSMRNFFLGGGDFLGESKKKVRENFGGEFFRGGGNFWKNFKKKDFRGNFKGGSYVGGFSHGFLPWGQGSHTPLQGWPGGSGGDETSTL